LPSPHTLVRIAEALHVAARDFFAPEEKVIPEIAKALYACFMDVRLSLKQSVEKSIEESIKKVMEYYVKPLEPASYCNKM
jgi:transcriptional regulator with XRE-family HTH domain